MSNIDISIILPVYNVDKYLNKCIDSILNQSFKNFELIIIDDGSTDNSSLICENYLNTDNRIKVIHQENKGLSYARNVGINLANGKYIAFIDSDDYIDVNYLEVLHSIIVNEDADIVMCDRIYVFENKIQFSRINSKYSIMHINKENIYKKMMLNDGISFSVWGKLYSRKIFDSIRFIDGKLYEDIFIVNDIIESSDKIVVTTYNGYYYLKRKNSIMSSKMNLKQMDLIDASIKYKDFMLDNYPRLSSFVNRGFVIANYTILNKAILNKNFINETNYLRNNILSYKCEIFTNYIYSPKIKFQTFLLLFGNNVYNFFYSLHKRKDII